MVVALALWFGLSGAWSIYANLGGMRLSPERLATQLSAPEDVSVIERGFHLGWLAAVGIFGVLALVAAAGLLVGTRWARWVSLIYLALAIAIRLIQAVGVALFVGNTTSLMDRSTVNLAAVLAPWAVGIVLRFLALGYLARTDPSRR